MRSLLALAFTIGLATTAAAQMTTPVAPAILAGPETAETGVLLVHDWLYRRFESC